MDKRYVRYKNRYKKKEPRRADHLKRFQFKRGESGNPIMRLAQIRKKIERGEPLTPEEKMLAALKPHPPWKPGESGNPAGSPTGSFGLVTRLKAYLRRHPEEADQIVEQLVKKALAGGRDQLAAIEQIIDRVDGKPTETRVITGNIPIRIEFVPARELLAKKKAGEIVEGEFRELPEAKDD